MADTGIRTPNLAPGVLTHVLGNEEEAPGKYVTRLQAIAGLAQSLIGEGPLRDLLVELQAQIAAIAEAVGANPGTIAGFGQRLTDLEGEVQGARAGSDNVGARFNAVVNVVAGVQIAVQSLKDAAQPRPTAQEFRAQATYIPLQKTFTVTIPTLVKAEYGGDVTIPGQTVTLDAPTSASFTQTVIIRSPGRLPDGRIDTSNFVGDRLLYRFSTGHAATRQTDGTAAVRGVDYEIKPNTGLIYGLKQVPDFAVTMTATGWTSRYDVIYGPFGTNGQGGLGVGVLKGTNRIIDPSMYRPAVPAGLLPIYNAYVYVAPDGTPRAELIPVYRYRGRDRIDQPGVYASLLERNRRCLARVRRRLNRGLPVPIVAYSDSIPAQGGGMGANQTVPNVDRDVLSGPAGYYITDTEPLIYGRMPADTAAAIPRYDGPLGAGKHVRLSPLWYLKTAIANAFGVDCPYLNMGVPGSTSANSVTSGIRNGLDPTRLNAMLAYAKDALLVLHFGTNELGMPDTRQNLVAIGSAWYNAGGLGIIIMPPPQMNYAGGRAPATQWLDTHNQCVQAAMDLDCAYIESTRIDGQYPYKTTKVFPEIDTDPVLADNLNLDQWHHGCSGLSYMDLCDINLFNHPGPEQLKHYGYALADIFEASEFAARPTNAPVSFDTITQADGTYSITLPNGVIEKGGPIPAGGSPDAPLTFAVPFPNACFEIDIIEEPTDYGTAAIYEAFAAFRSATGFTYVRRSFVAGSANGAAAAFACRWRARGN